MNPNVGKGCKRSKEAKTRPIIVNTTERPILRHGTRKKMKKQMDKRNTESTVGHGEKENVVEKGQKETGFKPLPLTYKEGLIWSLP